MAAEGDYIMVNKIVKSGIATQTELIWDSYSVASGHGLHNSKSVYKVDLHNYLYDVSCHLKIIYS